MIKLQKVSKYFDKKKALDNISFSAGEGEIIGFVGPNGAGKTTTMRIIVGFLEASSGTVTIDHADPINDRIDILKKVGYLAENNPLYVEMKVREYLEFVAAIKADKKNLTAIQHKTGISEVMNIKIEELSRGFKQRVGLAASLLGEPKILILDEPTSGLDPIEQENIRHLVKSLGAKKTIILSTHILSEVEDMATRIIIINKGKLIYDGVKPKGRGSLEKLFKKLVS